MVRVLTNETLHFVETNGLAAGYMAKSNSVTPKRQHFSFSKLSYTLHAC